MQHVHLLPTGQHFAVGGKGADSELLLPEHQLADTFHALVDFVPHWPTMPPTYFCCSMAEQAPCVELLPCGHLSTLHLWPYVREMI